MFTYPSPIFGPIMSRRLGVSLGVNLMPGDGKVCTFDCLYCECGFNKDYPAREKRPSREQVREALEKLLAERKMNGEALDTISFAGNGEPTAHPDFAAIVYDTLKVRDAYFPNAKVSVLSNATMIGRPEVREALMMVDNNIQKLDTVNADYIKLVDRPQQPSYDVDKVIECLKMFEGKVVIQTIFMKGFVDGVSVDNTTEAFVGPWIKVLKEIAPEKVMVYTIDRETPQKGLEKADADVLEAIGERVRMEVGVPCSVSH